MKKNCKFCKKEISGEKAYEDLEGLYYHYGCMLEYMEKNYKIFYNLIKKDERIGKDN